MDTMALAIKDKHTTNVVIDSVTGLHEHKEVIARQVMRQFFNFLKIGGKQLYSLPKRDLCRVEKQQVD